MWQQALREQIPSTDAAIQMFQSASHSLTSVNLDWVLTSFPKAVNPPYYTFFRNLFACRFPNLRAFQFRNAVVAETKLPENLYLFSLSHKPGTAGLDFIEAHPNLSCLAWPMEHFFSPRKSSADIETRIAFVVHNLGRTLTDLRVDVDYAGHGEPMSESVNCPRPSE
jgi:hypothetical protein